MVTGYERQRAYLDRTLRMGRIFHAYLFYGPHAEKIREIAAEFIRSVTGENVHHILSISESLVAKKEDRREIPIEDIRELKRRLSLTAAGNGWRSVLIDGAAHMSMESANALLKLLEEPGERTLFILTAPSRELVLPTIASRTIPLYFGSDIARFRPESGVEQIIERAMRSGATAELFQLAATAAFDTQKRRSVFGALIFFLRRRLIESPHRRDIASSLKKVLEISGLAETTNVNSRLALDIAFLEAEAVYTQKK